MSANAAHTGIASSSQPIMLRGCRVTITVPAIAAAAANALNITTKNGPSPSVLVARNWPRLAHSTSSAARNSPSAASTVTTSPRSGQVST